MNIPRLIILVCVILSGLFFLCPYLDFQDLLSAGDHGRDLYAFWATAQGDMPYTDYWWVYGPLMPYYYAVFLKLFGVTIPSILWGKICLQLVGGVFIFLTLELWITPLLAYAGALWFWAFGPDFFFTYNHQGGIALLAAAVYCLLAYIKNPQFKYLNRGLLCIFLLALVKVNFGLAALAVFLGGIFLADRIGHKALSREKVLFYYTALSLLPLGLLGLYLFFLRGLPEYAIRQCLPYLSADHPYNAPLFVTLSMWWEAIALNINSSWADRIFALIIISLGARAGLLYLSQKTELMERKKILLTLSVLAGFYLINLHEYFLSSLLYRTEWSKPFSILMIFFTLHWGLKNVKRSTQILLPLALIVVVGLKIADQTYSINRLKRVKFRAHHLQLERAQVFVGNNPDWIDTVTQTTRQLENLVNPNETFLALPFNPLYYYLTGRKAPTRQLIFYEHINIPPQQEREIIAALESKKVNYVLLSNHAHSTYKGLGRFGQTYCPLLGRYLEQNFAEFRRLGNWEDPPGWAWNHGTLILKRNL